MTTDRVESNSEMGLAPGDGMPPLPSITPDLGAILEAWHQATLRLEQTHQVLQAEVKRLTAELEKKNRELARKNRLADLGRMAAHIAHELRNSLVPVSLYMSLLKRRIAEDAREIVEKIEQAIEAAQSVLNDILQFAADREPQESLFLLKDVVSEVLKGVEPQLSAQKVNTQVNIAPELFAWADRDLLRRVLLNLILNALDAMPHGGTLVVEATGQNGTLHLSVADSGPGLTEEALQRAFEPFFTTKSGGTGLGLAIVERLIELHGGTVTAGNGPRGGAVFRITLPGRAVVPTQNQRMAA